MQHTLRTRTFPNGDILSLDATDDFVGLRGLTVYTVSYAEQDGANEFQSVGGEPFMAQSAAETAFEKRVASNDPSKPTSPHNDTYNLVTNTFARYLGEHSLRPVPPPKDWDGFMTHVVKKAFGSRDEGFGDVLAALDGLTNTSPAGSGGRSDVVLHLPAWKVLEMVTTITALAMALRGSVPLKQVMRNLERAA